MTLTLVVDPGPFDWRLGVVDDAGLARLRVVDLVGGVEGAWFHARVRARASDLGGLFADIGAEAPVFVRLPAALGRRPPPEGAALLVQGVADAVADKGARVTPRLAVEGPHLTLHDDGDGPRLGPGVPTAVAPALRSRARALFAGRPVEIEGGAEAVDDETLAGELAALTALRATLEDRFAERDAPGPLLSEDERLAHALRRLTAGVDRVVTTEAAALRTARLLAATGLEPTLVRADDPWAEAGIEDGLEVAMRPEVPFADGAALVVEPTAACVAVDVDRRRSRLAPAALNARAAEALARTVAVRELAGQLVVDFLDPGGAKDRDSLVAGLADALGPLDGRVVTVLRSGLAVVERPRRSAALHERVDPTRSAAERLLRHAASHAMVEAAVAADVDDRLSRPFYAAAVRAWLATHGSRLVRRRDPGLPAATFIIESELS